jgi:hypothetical protein
MEILGFDVQSKSIGDQRVHCSANGFYFLGLQIGRSCQLPRNREGFNCAGRHYDLLSIKDTCLIGNGSP